MITYLILIMSHKKPIQIIQRSQTSVGDTLDSVQTSLTRSNNIKVIARFRPLVEFEKVILT